MEKKDNVIIKSPQKCSDKELLEFKKMVCLGGQVQTDVLQQRIENAHKLIFVFENKKLVSTAAIKQPSMNYKKNVFNKAGVTILQNNFIFEIGYIYSIRSGLGNILMESINSASSNLSCFATTRKDNKVMHHLLKKSGYTQLGSDYMSDRDEFLLSLYGKKA